MASNLVDSFLRMRTFFYEKNKKNRRIWYTFLVTGNFRNTALYHELSGKHKPFTIRPLFGFLRYCLIDLPFFAKHLPPDGRLLVATVFIRQSDQKVTEAFFGELLSKLEKVGNKLICIGKVAHHFNAAIEDKARDNLGQRVFCPSHLLTKWDGLRCIIISLFSFLKCSYPEELKIIFAKDMSHSHISEFLSALLYETMIKKIISKNPDIHILHPFEGNTWESACALSGQYCVGYQHSSILNDQLKISYFPDKPIPSKIITTGFEASQQLSNVWGYPSDMLIDGFSLRQAKIYNIEPRDFSPPHVSRILLLMQGTEHQNGTLEMISKFMKLERNIKISLRPHPAVPIAKMGVEDMGFSVSNNPDLYQDILNHDVCLYVSSTAALEAIYLGVPVIHLVVDQDIDSDPLSGIKYLKRDAITAEDIAIHLHEFANYSSFGEEFVLARRYFEGYFSKPSNFMEEQFKEWLALSSVS